MKRLRNRHLLVSDLVLLAGVPFVAYALRFEGWTWSEGQARTAMMYAVAGLAIRLAVYLSMGLYSRLWAFASISEVELLFASGILGAALSSIVGGVVLEATGLASVRVPLSVLFMSELMAIGVVAMPRVLLRVGERRWRRYGTRGRVTRRALVAGAGAAGAMLVKELFDNPQLGLEPVGFLDDDPAKLNHRLAGVPVLGPLSRVSEVAARINARELVIAMPRADGSTIRHLVRAAHDAELRTRTVPGLYEIVSGKVTAGALREVRIEDLLRREPIETDLQQVSRLAAERTVMVTGAGGSIGSELARQIAALCPTRLVLVGHGENPIFHIHNELRAAHRDVDIVPAIADIRDRHRIRQVVEEHRPFALFHAAAHKHVPLMEENVVEAITNNVEGTWNLVEAAHASGVEHFVLISTDKAVRPTNVMGATKRLAEHIVRHTALTSRLNYVAVRFGNVLGSQGSVVPTFMEQIRRGGPVTVTHPDMRRFFMTIPEAVQLVLQAGALGRGGELFMLDMGEPVRIVDLATDLIRLSGLEPDVDVKIEFSGIRPGEKMYEEMFLDHERATPTGHPKVLCVTDELRPGELLMMKELVAAARKGEDADDLRARLAHLVPDYRPSGDREVSVAALPVDVGSGEIPSAPAPRPLAPASALKPRGRRSNPVPPASPDATP